MQAFDLAVVADAIPMTPPPGFTELYNRYSAAVYRTALRITGNPADAEDALQTVFLRVLNHEEKLDHGGPLEPYFRRAATNAGLDILRRRSTRAEARLNDQAPHAAPDSPLFLKERLRRAIAKLSPRDAEMFALRYIVGLSNIELGEAFGMESSSIAVRLHRIRHSLQQEMER